MCVVSAFCDCCCVHPDPASGQMLPSARGGVASTIYAKTSHFQRQTNLEKTHCLSSLVDTSWSDMANKQIWPAVLVGQTEQEVSNKNTVPLCNRLIWQVWPACTCGSGRSRKSSPTLACTKRQYTCSIQSIPQRQPARICSNPFRRLQTKRKIAQIPQRHSIQFFCGTCRDRALCCSQRKVEFDWFDSVSGKDVKGP